LETAIKAKMLIFVLPTEKRLDPYYESKLELKSNSSEILPVNCKFICVHIFRFCAESQI